MIYDELKHILQSMGNELMTMIDIPFYAYSFVLRQLKIASFPVSYSYTIFA
jgi:hypothetical protein